MNATYKKLSLSSILCMVLIAVMALTMTGCGDSRPEPPPSDSPVYTVSETPHALGEGELSFHLTVTDLDGTDVQFEIATNETTVGAALTDLGLITGEQGPYGLMVTTVNGQTLVYEEDKAYWGFYIDGAYAMSGVDSTQIIAGHSYELRAERA